MFRILSIALLLPVFWLPRPEFATGAEWRGQDANQKEEKIYDPKEVDKKARILSRREPEYTEQARRKRTTGRVVLRVVLKSSGEIGDIEVVRDAPDGLTDECIRVAREIKFVPAQKDGQPVSTYVMVEYTFDVQ